MKIRLQKFGDWDRFRLRKWILGWGRLCSRPGLACVGVIVVLGGLNFLIAPDGGEMGDPRGREGLPVIVLDPGHGGTDEGCRGNGLLEKELTLEVALRVERYLQASGFETVLTRRADYRVGLSERAAFANEYEHSIFVSIHFNQSSYRSACGVEAFFARQKVPILVGWTWAGFFPQADLPDHYSEGLAMAVQSEVAAVLGVRDRGVKGRMLYVLHHVRAPAILIEGGFLSNLQEAQALAGEQYQEQLAWAIAQGIVQFQNLKKPNFSLPQWAQAGP